MRTARYGTFSSSNIYKLMTTNRAGTGIGAAGLTYIKQVNHERMLGKAINPERESRPTTWGKFVETRVFNLLDLSYELVSSTRLFHPEIDCWSGMPDLRKAGLVADVKCPYSLEVFCDKVIALNDIELYKEQFPIDYWQHVSNAILSGATEAEAVIYCPYQSELQEIREAAYAYDAPDQWQFRWICGEDEDLPHLLNGGHYKNLNVVRFTIPQADKDALTDRVFLASKSLVPFHTSINIETLQY